MMRTLDAVPHLHCITSCCYARGMTELPLKGPVEEMCLDLLDIDLGKTV